MRLAWPLQAERCNGHDLDLWPSLACRSVAEATSKAKDSGEWLGGGNRARLFFAELKAEPCLAEPCKGQACAPKRGDERRRNASAGLQGEGQIKSKALALSGAKKGQAEMS